MGKGFLDEPRLPVKMAIHITMMMKELELRSSKKRGFLVYFPVRKANMAKNKGRFYVVTGLVDVMSDQTRDMYLILIEYLGAVQSQEDHIGESIATAYICTVKTGADKIRPLALLPRRNDLVLPIRQEFI
jgi:hypothetical protein